MTVVRSQNQSEDRYQAFRDAVTRDLTARIKDGQAPWLMPVDPGSPRPDAFNAETGRLYRGMNALLMDSAGFSDPRWLSYARAQAVGAQVRGGEKGVRIEYWKQEEEQDRANRDGTLRPPAAFTGQPTIRYDRPDGPFVVTVFNAAQMDGMPPPALSPALDPCSEAERLVATSGIRILHDQRDRGFYKPDTDTIHMPGPDAFRSMEAFHAATLGHIIAATGHRSRLDRDAGGGSGPERQAHEALVNALASFTVTTRLGLGHDPSSHRHYVNNWLERIEKDPSFLFRATAEAAQASDWVRAPEYRQTLEQEVRSMKTHDPVIITPPAPEAERTRLYVPFSEKDAARDAGARWDKEQKFWYVTGQPGEEFSAWLTPPSRDRAPGQETAPAPEKAVTWLDVPEGAKTEQELTGLGARFDATERAWFVSGDVPPDLAPYRSVPDPDPVASFTAFCERQGTVLDGPAIMDGQWHKSENGLYRASAEGRPHGEFRYEDRYGLVLTVEWTTPPGTRITDRDPVRLEANSAVPPTVSPPSEPDKAVTWLDLDLDYEMWAYARDLGAQFDSREAAWFVSGDVPPDLAPYRAVPDPDPVASFTAFCKNRDLDLDGPPRMDGQWHHIGDAAYRLRADGRPRGELRRKDIWDQHIHTVRWNASPGTRITDRDPVRLEANSAVPPTVSPPSEPDKAVTWLDPKPGSLGEEIVLDFPEAQFDPREDSWYVSGDVPPDLAPYRAVPDPDPVASFTAFCKQHGLDLDGPPRMDGQWHHIGDAAYCFRPDWRPRGQLRHNDSSKPRKWIAAPGTRIPERDITWLELDPSDHEAARRAGAWWDRDKKTWYTVGAPGQEREQSRDVPITRLHVPFSEKDAARDAGARWDKEQKFWYVTGQPGEEFSAWLTPPPRQPEQDPVEAFTHACRDNGLVLDGPALMDGKWHRVRVADDRSGEKSGSYRGFLDGVPAGAIMNYRLGSEAVKWVASPERIPQQDMAAQIAHSRQMREKRDLELLERQERVAGLAETTWKEATGPVVNHDWLARKKVSPDLARMNQAGQVVVPACDMQGRVWNVQTIDPDGRKSFMKEGRVSGLMYVLPGKDGSKGPTILAEGFSTAATVHELTGNTVVVAFNAGNLPKVARTLRAANPDLDLLVAADDDHARTVNAGRQAAAAAARESGARMLLPPLTEAEKARGLTDWNDLRVARGAAKAREALDKAGLLATVRPAREQKQGRSQSTTAMALQ